MMKSAEQISEFYDKHYSRSFFTPKVRWSWAPAGPSILRHLDFLSQNSNGRLLDIACGTGWLLTVAEKSGLECYGVDISREAIAQAQKSGLRATIVCYDVDKGLDFPDEFFDYLTCMGSLEHFQQQVLVIQEMARIAKPTAKIYIFVPNESFILHKLGYVTDVQPVVKRYSLQDWECLLQQNGLRIQRVFKDNSYLLSFRESSNWLKHIGKILFWPMSLLLPLRLSYSFLFVCAKQNPAG